MFLYRIIFCLYHSTPEGTAVVYTNISDIFFLRVTSYEHGACLPHLYTLVYWYAPCGKSVSIGSFLLQRIALRGLILALPYNTILSKRNIDGFRLYIFLLTSSIRGHLLSLKFCLHRVTRTPHHQHRIGIIHGIILIPQHCKRVKKPYKWPKIWKALYIIWTHARMCVTKTYKMRICTQGAAVGRKTRAPAKRRIYWNWSASQPLMYQLPSRFDTKSELNPRRGAGQRPNGALKSPFSHSKEVT